MSSVLFDKYEGRPQKMILSVILGCVGALYFYISDNPQTIPDVYQKQAKWAFGEGTGRYFFGFVVLLVMQIGYFILTHHEQDFGYVRMMFTAPAVGLLIYRVIYYYQKGYLLYLIDFCFWSHFAGLRTLWLYEDLSFDYMVAVFAALNGPVGGATFLLRTPMLVHNPEAFESFFLHVVPMWASYSLRWNWGEMFFQIKRDDIPSIRKTVWAGFTMVYLPWALSYGVFVSLQPYLPVVANMETLFDWYAYGGKPTERTDPLHIWLLKVWVYLLVHAIMATQGLVAAAMSLQYQEVHTVWIVCVLVGTASSGMSFYYASLDPDVDVEPEDKLITGLKDCGIAWIFMLVTYAYCWWKYGMKKSKEG